MSQACKFPIPGLPAETLEKEGCGVWATLNSLHIRWFPVCSGAQTKALSRSKRILLFKTIPPTKCLGSILGTKPEGKIKLKLALSDVTFLLPLRAVICYCEEKTNELNKMCSGRVFMSGLP